MSNPWATQEKAFETLRAVVESIVAARVDALTADLATAREEIRRLEDESAARFASANVLHAKWQDAEQDLERVIANVRALADEWQAEGESLARNPYSGRDVHEGMTQQQCANAVRALLPAAPTEEQP